jgi:hypothetical protein
MTPDWHDLIQRHLAGACTQEECELLQTALMKEEAVARLYLQYANLEVALEAQANSTQSLREILLQEPAGNSSGSTTRRFFGGSFGRWAAAALFLVFAAAAFRRSSSLRALNGPVVRSPPNREACSPKAPCV